MNEAKLQQFMGQALNEMGAAMNTALVVIADKLGLYKAMSGAGAITSSELAQRTNREWCRLV